MGPKKLLVFDLETVPDVPLVRKLWPETEGMEDMAVVEHLYAKMREASNGQSDFPRPVFHKIVAIGCLLADIEHTDDGDSYTLRRLGCIGEEGHSERQLIEEWLDFGAREPLRLVSFNGRGFDMPVLKLRAMARRLAAGWLFQSGDKWSNYNSRYDMVWHVDMADVLSDFGAARGMPKLNEVSKLLNLPGKLDIDGSRVVDLFNKGQVKDIRDYCETDVLNTYLLYLRYQHLSGAVGEDALKAEEAHIADYCTENAPNNRPHLAAFLESWNTAKKS